MSDRDGIEHHESGDGGSFILQKDGRRMGALVYRAVRDGVVDITHTEVDPALRGQGLARSLVDAAVSWARENATRIKVTCPYARAQFEKDPSIRDVLAK